MKKFNNSKAANPDLPYEKCLREGPRALSDAQLIAVIIRTGVPGSDASELAEKILHLLPSKEGLLALNHLTVPELMEIPGIGRVKAIQLQCVGELSRRIASSRSSRTESFSTPEAVASYYMEMLRHEERECLHLMMLDTRGNLLREERLFAGSANQSLVSVREIFSTALRNRAVSIVLVHNHPSGDPTPSEEDIRVTQRVCLLGQQLEIRLLDHIIIGDRCFSSLLELGLLSPKSEDSRPPAH